MRPPWAEYFKEKVAEAGKILLATEMPRHPVRREATINAWGN